MKMRPENQEKWKREEKKNVSLILKLMLTKLHDKKPQIFEEKN